MSSSEIFAEPMLNTEYYLREYKEQLDELEEEGLLPHLDEILGYKVYTIRGSKFGAHNSIVLTTDDEHFVTVELGFIEVDGKLHIYPVTQATDKSAKDKMQHLGNINATGQQLIGKAVTVMRQFGNYFKLCNNCQDYCNMYAEAFGLRHAQTLTDGDNATLVWLLAAI